MVVLVAAAALLVVVFLPLLVVVFVSKCSTWNIFFHSLFFLFMTKEVQSLAQRRLDNLDRAVSYYQKRLSNYAALRAKCVDDESRALYDVQIKLLDDVVSYLKLC